MKTTKKITKEDSELRLYKRGYILISEYKNSKSKISVKDLEGYKYESNLSHLMKSRPDKVHQSNPYSIENISLYLDINNYDISLVSIVYENNTSDLIFKCGKHGDFTSNWNKINGGSGCNFCAGKAVHPDDSVFSKRKDLLKYFKNIDDSKYILCGSDKIVDLICPNCKKPKQIKMNYLNSSGFSCNHCSDGISIPEKFVMNILKQLDIDFIRQYRTDWTQNRRYDFFIIENKNKIIEAHGAQHYEGWSKNKKQLEKQIELDNYKYNLAVNNGIEPRNYIIIDCRKSELEWLKENCENELNNHFDLSYIDWIQVWDNCKSSLMIDICTDWCNKKEEHTTKIFCEKYNMDRSTIISYLKRGNKLGLCEYDPKYETNKNNNNQNKKRYTKPVIQYSLDMEYITEYPSVIEASRVLKIDNSGICKCCVGKRKSVGGYIWRYK